MLVKYRIQMKLKAAAVISALTLAAIINSFATSSLAQKPTGQKSPPGGPQGRPGGGFGGGGGQGFRQGGRGGPRMPASLASLPIPVLVSNLSLTSAQQGEIQKIHEKLAADVKTMFPQQAQGQARPDMKAMQALMEKMQAKNKEFSAKIDAKLTASQRKLVPDLLKDAGFFNQAGIPLEMRKDLALTSTQKTAISSIVDSSRKAMQAKMQGMQPSGDREAFGKMMQQSRKDMQDKVQSKLTAKQKAQVDKYVKDHPRRGRGGPGGPEGPGGPGGPGGGPRSGGAPRGNKGIGV